MREMSANPSVDYIEDDCVGHFELSPTCADPTLSLWNATNNPDFGFGYFCCLRTQIGLQNGECGLPLLLGPPSTNDAVLVNPPFLSNGLKRGNYRFWYVWCV